jgi:hypothetical protein
MMIIFSFQIKIKIKGLRHNFVNLFLVAESKGREVKRLVNQERMKRRAEWQRENHQGSERLGEAVGSSTHYDSSSVT